LRLTACYDAARRTGGRVIATRRPGVTPNFHTVVIGYGDDHVAILRHAWLGLIALAEDPDSGSNLVIAFIDRPVLAEILGQTTNCQILSAKRWNKPSSPLNASS
jgi:hypothetical protein